MRGSEAIIVGVEVGSGVAEGTAVGVSEGGTVEDDLIVLVGLAGGSGEGVISSGLTTDDVGGVFVGICVST